MSPQSQWDSEICLHGGARSDQSAVQRDDGVDAGVAQEFGGEEMAVLALMRIRFSDRGIIGEVTSPRCSPSWASPGLLELETVRSEQILAEPVRALAVVPDTNPLQHEILVVLDDLLQ